MKIAINCMFNSVNLAGVDYFNWPCSETHYFYNWIVLDVTFELHRRTATPRCPALALLYIRQELRRIAVLSNVCTRSPHTTLASLLAAVFLPSHCGN